MVSKVILGGKEITSLIKLGLGFGVRSPNPLKKRGSTDLGSEANLNQNIQKNSTLDAKYLLTSTYLMNLCSGTCLGSINNVKNLITR